MSVSAALTTSGRTGTGRDDWCTPECVLERVYRVGPIHVDPCASESSIIEAHTEYRLPSNGLALPWSVDGLTFVNPPFSALRAWVERCALWGASGGEVIALLPARTDTRAWQAYVSRATAVCLWRGRIRFIGATAGAPFPTAFAYWGPRVGRFIDAFADAGIVYGRAIE